MLALALPIIAANLTQPLLSLVDTAIAGHLPTPAALGGVALSTCSSTRSIGRSAFCAWRPLGLVAQAHGANDGVALRATILRALMLAAAIGLVLIAVKAPLVGAALDLLGGSADVVANAHTYCAIRLWAAPMALANYAILGTLLGQQRATTALVVQAAIMSRT